MKIAFAEYQPIIAFDEASVLLDSQHKTFRSTVPNKSNESKNKNEVQEEKFVSLV
jgi:hypothetical protein